MIVMWIETKWCVCIYLVAVIVPLVKSSNDTTPCSDQNHILLVPGVLTSGGSSRACLSRLYVTGSAQFFLTLRTEGGQPAKAWRELPAGDGGCLDISVPQMPNSRAELIAQLSYPSQCTWEKRLNLRIASSRIIVLHTERAKYRPGDTVKFRALVLRADLTPAHGVIDEVWLEGPRGPWDGLRVTQWSRTRTRLGIAQLQHQLDELAPGGKWTIRARMADGAQGEASFWVGNYELPPFHLSVKHASKVLRTTERLVWTVCVRYPWTEAVEGMLVIRIRGAGSSNSSGIRTAVRLKSPKACHRHAAAASRVGIDGKNNPDIIVADFSFQEEGTRIWQNTTVVSKVVDKPISLEFLSKCKSVIAPGLPYKLKVKATRWDDKPAPLESIRICRSKINSSNKYTIENQTQGEVCDDVITDIRGVARVLFVAENGISGYKFEASTNTTSSTPLLLSVSSGTNHAALGPLKVDVKAQNTFVPLYVRVRSDKPVTVHFVVITRGGTIYRWGATTQCPVSNPNQVLTMPRNSSCTHPDLSQISQIDTNLTDIERHVPRIMLPIKLSHQMCPDSHLVAFFYADGELITASKHFEMDECFGNKITTTFSSRQVLPGSTTTFHISTTGPSLCALTALDSAATWGVSRASLKDIILDGLKKMIYGHRNITEYDAAGVCFLSSDNPIQPTTNTQLLTSWLSLAGVRTSLEDKTVSCAPPESMIREDTGPRSDFSEAWLWRLVPIGSNGTASVTAKAPQSITRYEANAICLSKTGVATAQPAVLQVFRDFFIHADAPKRMKRGDIGILQIRIFNYLYQEVSYFGTLFFNMPCIMILMFYIILLKSFDVAVAMETFSLVVMTCIETFTPAFIAAKLTTQARELQIALHELKMNKQNPPRGVVHSDIQAFIQYIDVRPMKFTIMKVIPLDWDLPVLVTMTVVSSPHLSVTSSSKSMSIGQRSFMSSRAQIHADTSGVARVAVRAESQKGVKDEIIMEVVVEPEGIPVHEHKSILLCKDSQQSQKSEITWDFPPVSAVPETESITLWATGDVTGPLLSSADDLTQLPRGCGEQNMARLATNVLALQFLDPTCIAALNAKLHVARGFTRQLQYSHASGGFSAFGPTDDTPSTWLTAFTVRYMRRAYKILAPNLQIPPAIELAEKWLLNQQMENGCFNNVGQVFHRELKGGLNEQGELSTLALTAYATISLLQSTIPIPIRVIQNTLACFRALPPLKAKTPSRVYATALIAYAMISIRRYEEEFRSRNEAFEKEFIAGLEDNEENRIILELLKLAKKNEDHTWWEAGSTATSIESTSYAILALSVCGSAHCAHVANKAVAYLHAHTNQRGGFISTQDTLVALEALTKHASLHPQSPTNLTLSVKSMDSIKQMILKPGVRVPELMSLGSQGHLRIKVEGTGCALVQATRTYNTISPKHSPSSIGTQTQVVTEGSFHCKDDICFCAAVIEACVVWTGMFPQMALLEVSLPGGYGADATRLYAQLHNTDSLIRRIELTPSTNKATFYLTSDKEIGHFCTYIHTVGPQTRNKPGSVRVMDYYNTDVNDTQMFTIPEDCPSPITHESNQYTATDNLFNKAKSLSDGELIINEEFTFEDIPEGIPLEDPLYENLSEMNQSEQQSLAENNKNHKDSVHSNEPDRQHIILNDKIETVFKNETILKDSLRNITAVQENNHSGYPNETIKVVTKSQMNFESYSQTEAITTKSEFNNEISNLQTHENIKENNFKEENANLANFHVIESETDLDVPSGVEGPVPSIMLPPSNFVVPKMETDGVYFPDIAEENENNRRYINFGAA